MTTPLRYAVTTWHGEHASIARVIDRTDPDADTLGYYNSRDGAGWLTEARAHAARLNASASVATLRGTLDAIEPALRARGFTALRMMSGPVDLAMADPYGMRRVGSVNIPTDKWAHHVWQAEYIEIDGRPYLTDAEPATPPFVNGLFPLIREEG
jgi:hypothetical protein